MCEAPALRAAKELSMNTGVSIRRLSRAITAAFAFVGASIGLGGCASYATPGRGADMTLFTAAQAQTTDGEIREAFAREPLATFPASIAVARVQAPGYRNYAGREGYGSGKYSVVTTREVETDADFAAISGLAGVRSVAGLNRLVVPSGLTSDRELRAAAAGLRADLLLVYTFDTVFDSEQYAGAVSLVSLGLFPTKVETVKTTASAALLDTRTGFVHALAEGAGDAGQLANFWTSTDAADDARLRAEGRAFRAMVKSLVETWPGVLTANASRGAPAPASSPAADPAAAGMVR
jgi:hypothetical protein